MPIEVGIWNVSSDKIKKIEPRIVSSESRLEKIIEATPEILDEGLMIIGRQVKTEQNKFVDLLGINSDGKIIIIELKRDRTPREVVAQSLDYASWVNNLSVDDIKGIWQQYTSEKAFEEAIAEQFEDSFDFETINQQHEMLIVCAELDNETERIITYLSDNYDVPINVVFFKFYEDNGAEYLSRSWLISPNSVDEKSSNKRLKKNTEVWSGRDFVANINRFGEKSTWKDSIKYGFISPGGGRKYSKPLRNLFVGARVYAMIPSKGYLGVGVVEETVKPINEFKVKINGTIKSFLDLELNCPEIKQNSDSEDLKEYLVKVRWIKTYPEESPYWEKGMRANQNVAYKLKNQFTIDKLESYFNVS